MIRVRVSSDALEDLNDGFVFTSFRIQAWVIIFYLNYVLTSTD